MSEFVDLTLIIARVVLMLIASLVLLGGFVVGAVWLLSGGWRDGRR